MRAYPPPLRLIACLVACVATPALGQSFSQIEIGSGASWRLSESLTQANWGLRLIGGTAGMSSYVNLNNAGKSYQFIADPFAGRLVTAKQDDWFVAWTNENGLGGSLRRPTDVDVAQSGRIFVSDMSSSQVYVTTFSSSGVGNAVAACATNMRSNGSV